MSARKAEGVTAVAKKAYGLPCSAFDHKPDRANDARFCDFRLTVAAALHINNAK
jgi:hypothetical protein